MNTVINAAVALLPMGVMFVGLLKMLGRSNVAMERHMQLVSDCEKASKACEASSETARRAFELAAAAERHVLLPEVRELALEALRASHRWHDVLPAPRFERPATGTSRMALIEMT